MEFSKKFAALVVASVFGISYFPDKARAVSFSFTQPYEYYQIEAESYNAFATLSGIFTVEDDVVNTSANGVISASDLSDFTASWSGYSVIPEFTHSLSDPRFFSPNFQSFSYNLLNGELNFAYDLSTLGYPSEIIVSTFQGQGSGYVLNALCGRDDPCADALPRAYSNSVAIVRAIPEPFTTGGIVVAGAIGLWFKRKQQKDSQVI